MEDASYTARGRHLVEETAEAVAAIGPRMDKLGDDIEELLTDQLLDMRERMVCLLELLLEEYLPARKLQPAASLARRLAESRIDLKDAGDPPLRDWAAELADRLLGPTLGGLR